jgi:hypothetical protein
MMLIVVTLHYDGDDYHHHAEHDTFAKGTALEV